MRPVDCHNCEYAPVLVLEHSVMETLMEPYDDANVSITWAGREASPRTRPGRDGSADRGRGMGRCGDQGQGYCRRAHHQSDCQDASAVFDHRRYLISSSVVAGVGATVPTTLRQLA